MSKPDWAATRYNSSAEYDIANNIKVATEEICKRLDEQNSILKTLTKAFILDASNIDEDSESKLKKKLK